MLLSMLTFSCFFVDDVKAEISKKRSENKSVYYARGRRGKAELAEEKNLTL